MVMTVVGLVGVASVSTIGGAGNIGHGTLEDAKGHGKGGKFEQAKGDWERSS